MKIDKKGMEEVFRYLGMCTSIVFTIVAKRMRKQSIIKRPNYDING